MVDATDIVSGIAQRRNEALPAVVGNIDEDPDRAQRAYDLAKITGAPATSIYGDLDDFERNTKAKMASDIVANNPHIGNFVQSDPMVPKIFANSYGFLDDVSAKVSAMRLSNIALPKDPLARFKEGPIGGSAFTDEDGKISDDIHNYPLGSALVMAAMTIPDLISRGIMTGVDMAKNLATAAGGESFGREVGAAGELEAFGLTGRGHGPAELSGLAHEMFQRNEALRKATDDASVALWLENGKVPPPTVLPEYDKYLAQQNIKDIERLLDATKASGTVPERATNPELYRQFIADHTDAEIGISGDAVAALYGDKLPAPGDSLLGWVPGIADKVAAARATGDDVMIPLADWMTHIPDYPEVMKALHDDIRVRPEGITKNEDALAKELNKDKPELEPLADPIATTRAAYDLEPKLSVGDRKLKLERLTGMTPEDIAKGLKNTDLAFHDFKLLDEKGNTVGSINLSLQKGGKQLYVDMVNGVNGLGPRDFGPALMRDLLRQLKAEFPEAETITGHRVSGARDKAGSYMAASAIPVVKLDRLDSLDHDTLRSILEGGQWETFSPSTQAYIKPQFALSVSQRALTQTVADEAKRIAPKKVSVQTPVSIKVDTSKIKGQRAGEDIKVGGIYLSFRNAYPIILAALDSNDALGTLRHEVIHHLRAYGFIHPEEWAALKKEALTKNELGQDWLDKYRIHELYPTADLDLKIEESIAERYREWVRDQRIEGMTGETVGLFQLMKEFFDNIRERISQMFGKPVGWEDVFQKIDTGEVGSREDTIPRDARAYNRFDDKLSREERIRASAIQSPSGKVYEDANHGLAFEKYANAEPDYLEKPGYTEGFTTTAGRYVSREEANEIANRTGQVDKSLYKSSRFDTDKQLISQNIPQQGALDPKLSVQPPEGGSRPHERAQTLGMPVGAFRAYDKRLQERHAEDLAKATERAEKQKARELTKEWKSNRVEVRKEVADSIRNRPDVAADLFLAGDGLYGRRRGMAYKLDEEKLTPKQKAMLPPEYYGRDGLDPDDVAGMFGYGSGDAMVDKLTAYNVTRRMANMSSKDFVNKITDIETDRQMKLRYGNLDENIMDAAKEQAIGETGQNVVHEETVYYGSKIGAAPATRENILAAVKQEFGKRTLGSVSSDRLMKLVGQQGRMIEALHLKEDWEGAFRLAQQREYTAAIAAEALKVEKELAKFNKTVKPLAKQWNPQKKQTIAASWNIYMRDILSRVERPYGMSVQGLEKAISESGYKGLQDFIETKEKDNAITGLSIPVADFLLDPNFHKPLNELSVDEFRGLHQSIDALKHLGREEQQIEVAGEKQDLADLKGQMRTQLAQKFDAVKVITKPGILRTGIMSMMNLETVFARFDGRDPRGLFTKFFTYPGMEAGSYKVRLEKEFAGVAAEMGKIKDPDKKLDSPFVDPHNGEKIPFTRKDLELVIANMGNAYNEHVLNAGWKVDPTVLRTWLEQVTTPEDWARAQARGDMFAKAKKMSDTVYQQMYGVAPEDIQVRPITMHGITYPGWYHPIDYDPLRSRLSKLQSDDPSKPKFDSFWPSPNNAYTKRRTGNVDVINITNPEMIPIKLNQILHDVAFRQFIANSAKITRDNGFRRDISYHYGPEYVEAIDRWLEKIAGDASFNSNALGLASRWSNFIRQNVISTQIAFSTTTVLKHFTTALATSAREVGPVKFARVFAEVGADAFRHAVNDLFGKDPDMGESLWHWAINNSEELQSRDRNYLNTMMGQHDILLSGTASSKFARGRNKVAEIGSKAVAFSDLISAVPTWIAAYREALRENPDAGEATYIANRAVRRAHGSTSVVNQPMIVNNRGVLAPWMTTIYGFFGTNMQRRFEIAQDLKDTYKIKQADGLTAATKTAPQIAASIFVYVAWVGMVEEAVSGMFTDDKRSWGHKALNALINSLSSTIIGLRDVEYGLAHGRDPQLGLLGAPLQDLKRLVDDAKKPTAFDRRNAGKFVQDTLTVGGDATGYMPKHIAAPIRYGIDVYNGTQKAKTAGDIFRGVVTGQEKEKVER